MKVDYDNFAWLKEKSKNENLLGKFHIILIK